MSESRSEKWARLARLHDGLALEMEANREIAAALKAARVYPADVNRPNVTNAPAVPVGVQPASEAATSATDRAVPTRPEPAEERAMDPLLSAPMARMAALEDKAAGKPYALVNPDWLVALIDTATPPAVPVVAQVVHLSRATKVPAWFAWCDSGPQPDWVFAFQRLAATCSDCIEAADDAWRSGAFV